MAIQYYNIIKTGKKYAVDKSTGSVKEVPSIPAGGATINWGGSSLPSVIRNAKPNAPTPVRTAPRGMENPTTTSRTSPNGFIYRSDGAIIDSETGRMIKKPRIPDSVYNQIRMQLQQGNLTPDQARSHLQGLINSGEYSETVNNAKLYAPLDNIRQRDGIYKFANDGSGRMIKTSATAEIGGNRGVAQTGIASDKGSLQSMLADIVGSVVQSGKVINPNLSDAELDNLDVAQFLAQAEREVAPEYKQKFDQVKNDLSQYFARTGEDLQLKIDEINRQEEKTKLEADESFAGRGLTFSSRRNQFNQNLAEESNRSRNRSRTLAFRGAEDKGRMAERLIGTESLRDLSLPTIGERRFELSSTPQIGSLEREKQYTKEQMARQLEFDERKRRAYTARKLSFA